jgi:hypothetical protein
MRAFEHAHQPGHAARAAEFGEPTRDHRLEIRLGFMRESCIGLGDFCRHLGQNPFKNA